MKDKDHVTERRSARRSLKVAKLHGSLVWLIAATLAFDMAYDWLIAQSGITLTHQIEMLTIAAGFLYVFVQVKRARARIAATECGPARPAGA